MNGEWAKFSKKIEKPEIIKEMIKIPDEIIVCLEEVQLKIAGDINKNYIALSLLKLDPEKIEEGYYGSKLVLYEIDSASKSFKFIYTKTFEMTITCLSHYQGHLVAIALED